MTLNFYIGKLIVETGKGILSSRYFAFRIIFYGRGYYKFKKKMRRLKSEHRRTKTA